MTPIRTLGTLAAVCAAILGGGLPAAAAPPDAVDLAFSVPGTDTAGLDGYCPFEVAFVGFNDQHLTAKGRLVGAAVVTATNVVTGTSIRFNASGPGVTVTAADGSFRTDASGPQLSFTTVRNSFPGVAPLSYTRGRVFFEVDAEGMTTAYGVTGKVVDVCAALA